MRTSRVFQPADPGYVASFVAAYPFAQVVSGLADDYEATPLPLVADLDSEGRIKRLIGHFARNNRHVDLIRRSPRAIVIFMGAHGYVSPSWMRDRTQAPTWNFETAQFIVDISLTDAPKPSSAAIERLLDHVEDGRPNRWQSHELGARHDRLLEGVIGFQATVIETRVKMKLGQNERSDVFEDIVEGLSREGNVPLARAMCSVSENRSKHHRG